MTRRFLIMRHAKSSWAEPGLADHDRPLNKRGRAAATAMGDWLAAEGLIPDEVLLSSAARTVETLLRISEHWDNAPAALGDRELYMAWPAKVIEMLRRVDSDARTVMLVNHEPTVSALAEVLSAPPIPDNCARAFRHYPTAAVAVLDTEKRWAEVGPETMRFTHFQVPREL